MDASLIFENMKLKEEVRALKEKLRISQSKSQDAELKEAIVNNERLEATIALLEKELKRLKEKDNEIMAELQKHRDTALNAIDTITCALDDVGYEYEVGDAEDVKGSLLMHVNAISAVVLTEFREARAINKTRTNKLRLIADKLRKDLGEKRSSKEYTLDQNLEVVDGLTTNIIALSHELTKHIWTLKAERVNATNTQFHDSGRAKVKSEKTPSPPKRQRQGPKVKEERQTSPTAKRTTLLDGHWRLI